MPKFDPYSVSYPTAAAIEEFDIQGDEARSLAWVMAGAIADIRWGRGDLDAVVRGGEAGVRLQELIGYDKQQEFAMVLNQNLARAIQWCKDNK